MKNILLMVHDDEGQEARLQAALDVVRAVEGHLSCVDLVMTPDVPAEWDGGAAIAMLVAEERTRETANREALEQRLTREDVPWTWVDTTGEPVHCLKQTSALADLMVVSRDPRARIADLLRNCDKPILAVPDELRGVDLAGRVLVAWDGSAEAEHALKAALPLLKLADQVMLLQVDDGSVRTPAGEAATFLSRHGIHPLVLLNTVAKGGAAEVILAEIGARNADYVVMGGFGGSRIVEALFGGVSRRLLAESTVPLFMAH